VWSKCEDITPTPEELESVVALLEAEHGLYAADMAEFFAAHHSLNGDAGRCWAWTGVADRIREREEQRLDSAFGH